MRKKIISEDLKHLIFDEIYHRYNEPKTRRKAFAVLESSINVFAKKGFENVTFKMISREAGLTPPSLRYYFSDLEEIKESSAKYVHIIAQKIVVEALTKSDEPHAMLNDYLWAHYAWASNFKNHLHLWLGFIFYSSRRKKERALNTEAVLNGAYRISEILAKGRKTGVFKHDNDFASARMIQTLILGWLTTISTEDIENSRAYSSEVIQECMRIVLKG